VRTLAGAFCVIAAAAALRAQQAPQPPRFADRVDVSNVVVDARVFDDKGAPVRGLAASQFTVTIGGKPARVVSVQFTGDAPPVPADLQSRAFAIRQAGELVVLLFQKSLVRARARGYVRMVGQSRELVRALPPSARVAVLVFDTSLKVWTDFTSDRALVDRILAHDLLRSPPPRTPAPGNPPLLAALSRGSPRIENIERVFEAVGDALRPFPGSKAIAFVGYGMGATPFGDRQDTGAPEVHARFGTTPEHLASNGEMNNEYRRAWRALTAARVSVFSLDISESDAHSLAVGMRVIAADTGGFYASSPDFPERPMRLVAGALSGHYVLFVEPPDGASDRTVAVSVEASVPTTVFATSSYRARP
jgi:VWFA-related protein